MQIPSFIRKLVIPVAAVVALAGSAAMAQETTSCPPLPGTYVKLVNQPYALCAGASTVNFNEVTYAKCKRLVGTSISLEQKYPAEEHEDYITIPNSGNVANVNAGKPNKKGYVVSTYSPPNGAVLPRKDLALYSCDSGSYAQCDGGICFNSTTGNSSALWGKVARDEVICSCPVIRSETAFQVVGPGQCPTTREAYDQICGKALASTKANGAVHFIGAPTLLGYETLSQCLRGTEVAFNKCERPEN